MVPAIDRVYVNERARRELGWRPRHDFASVIARLARGREIFAARWRIADRRQGLPSRQPFFLDAGAWPDNDMSTTKPRKKPEDLRSQQWFGRQDRDGFAYRSWVKGKGVPHDQFDGRPVIGICNTFSELTPATRTSARSPSR